jgi:predicted RNase H-like HicB family nuclease
MKKKFTITFEKDEEANVWVITSKDVPGLALEAETFKRAIQRLTAIPELWKMNYGKELE